MLNTTSRNLWLATNLDDVDDKTKWNIKLFQAISSSYADFLINGKHYYVDPNYGTLKTALNDIIKYCAVFPNNRMCKENEKNQFLHDVFKTLVQGNAEVLCVFEYIYIKKKEHFQYNHSVVSANFKEKG